MSPQVNSLSDSGLGRLTTLTKLSVSHNALVELPDLSACRLVYPACSQSATLARRSGTSPSKVGEGSLPVKAQLRSFLFTSLNAVFQRQEKLRVW